MHTLHLDDKAVRQLNTILPGLAPFKSWNGTLLQKGAMLHRVLVLGLASAYQYLMS